MRAMVSFVGLLLIVYNNRVFYLVCNGLIVMICNNGYPPVIFVKIAIENRHL